MSQETGYIFFRIATPTTKVIGSEIAVTKVSWHVDREHLGERDEDHRALHQHRRRHHEVLLDRTDVGVGPGDQLAHRDPVVEGERKRHVVLVDDVAQVVLEAVRGRQQAAPADVVADLTDADRDEDQGREARKRLEVRACAPTSAGLG